MSGELTEDALVRQIYHLSTLYDLNQEISTLRSVSEVLKSSLLYIIGVFGLRRGLIAIYGDDAGNPRELAYRGMRKKTALNYLQKLNPHLESSHVNEVYIAQETSDSPLAGLLKDYLFQVWLPLRIDENLQGGIALGAKLSEVSFTQDDLRLLSTIAINVQNVLSNVSLIEALNQAFIKENRIRSVFQRYAPKLVINEVLDPSNENLLLGESESVRRMFDDMISQLEEQYTLKKDLDMAHQVQEYLLPDNPPAVMGVEIAALSIPARGVCGDFYDFIPLSPYEVGLSLADISGKGMSAAMIATMLQSATRMCVSNYYPITAVLSILNRFMFRHTESGSYATMFYGQVDTQDFTFTYSNAGNPPAILCRDGKIRLLETGGSVVGIFEHFSYDQEVIKLQSNDILVIYSDGVTDAGITPESSSFEDGFGQERLETAVISHASFSADELIDALSSQVIRYAHGNRQFDDITLIVMKVK
jgi:serine phosphatase RsbU (regulator of sigma subunit)